MIKIVMYYQLQNYVTREIEPQVRKTVAYFDKPFEKDMLAAMEAKILFDTDMPCKVSAFKVIKIKWYHKIIMRISKTSKNIYNYFF